MTTPLTADFVQQTTNTVGTGTLVLIPQAGWVTFAAALPIGALVYYSIRDGLNWELGRGTVAVSGTLIRTTIMQTYSAGILTLGGTALNLSGIGAIVRAVAPAELLTAFQKVEYATIATSSTLQVGYAYAVSAINLLLTLPTANLSPGDRIRIFSAIPNIIGCAVDPLTEKIMSVTGQMQLDLFDFDFSLAYTGASYGWKVEA